LKETTLWRECIDTSVILTPAHTHTHTHTHTHIHTQSSHVSNHDPHLLLQRSSKTPYIHESKTDAVTRKRDERRKKEKKEKIKKLANEYLVKNMMSCSQMYT
jgi:hypothetical protein